MSRAFEDKPAIRSATPLLIGCAGPSGSGKTFSALRLATGIQRVVGGDIFFIDTEHRRGLHYADRFKFRHVDFEPPFGSLAYMDAIEHCVRKGAKVLVIDSMTHEHSGPGGILDRSNTYLDDKAGADEYERQKLLMASLVAPKRDQKKLNNAIVQLGVNAVFCYRARDAVKPVKGQGVKHLGWQPETTSPLIYEMAQCFLLPPGSDGKPQLTPETAGEKLLTKNPEQFRGWFKDGLQLDEAVGQRMAEWARGESAAPAAAEPADYPTGWIDWSNEERATNRAGLGSDAFRKWWATLDQATRDPLKARMADLKAIAAESDKKLADPLANS